MWVENVFLLIYQFLETCVKDLETTAAYYMDDLKEVVAANREDRLRKAMEAEAIIDEELKAFEAWRDWLGAVPTENGYDDRTLENMHALNRMFSLETEISVLEEKIGAKVEQQMYEEDVFKFPVHLDDIPTENGPDIKDKPTEESIQNVEGDEVQMDNVDGETPVEQATPQGPIEDENGPVEDENGPGEPNAEVPPHGQNVSERWDDA
ncbi:hypothetical protein L1987_87969 [Smallanthus sonchifolius]|nr:hypothetical protein L1987_87969 [Smallanthus sonchifolius]